MPTNDAFAALGNGVITSMVLAPNLEKLRQANELLLRGLAKLAAKSKQLPIGVFLVKHDFKIVVFLNHSVKKKWNIVQT